MKAAEFHSGTFSSSILWSLLINGVKWLLRASEVVSLSGNFKRCKLSEAEEILSSSQVLFSPFFWLVIRILLTVRVC